MSMLQAHKSLVATTATLLALRSARARLVAEMLNWRVSRARKADLRAAVEDIDSAISCASKIRSVAVERNTDICYGYILAQAA